MLDLQQAWTAHQQDLLGHPSTQAKLRALAIWNRIMQADAHDYMDWIIKHPQRNRILELHANAIGEAYLYGYLARRGWVEEVAARRGAFGLGRTLRDEVRALGVGFQSL